MAFIEKLLRDMTLKKRIGQLTMGGGEVVHSGRVKEAELLREICVEIVLRSHAADLISTMSGSRISAHKGSR